MGLLFFDNLPDAIGREERVLFLAAWEYAGVMANTFDVTDELLKKVCALSLDDQRRLLEVIATLPSAQAGAAPTTAANGSTSKTSVWQQLSALGTNLENAPCELPEDLAANHDHYLHGLPKRS